MLLALAFQPQPLLVDPDPALVQVAWYRPAPEGVHTTGRWTSDDPAVTCRGDGEGLTVFLRPNGGALPRTVSCAHGDVRLTWQVVVRADVAQRDG